MAPEPRRVPKESSQQCLGSLSACLVHGDADQRRRERCVRRRALALSVLLQSAVLTLLVLLPLFGKTERIVMRDYVPVSPYGHVSNHPRGNEKTGTSRPTHSDWRFIFHPPTSRADAHPLDDHNPMGAPEFGPGNQANRGPDCSWCVNLGGQDAGPGPPPAEVPTKPRVLQITRLDPAMLIHRVEPVYPALGRQLHRDGHVELRAIIGTEGTIQSLQIVVSDPLFDQSAVEAVRQWRYRPTVLNGQPVEIDTYITVIYTMQH